MTSTESPAVARRRLRLALRKAREAKGYTQAEVAEALEWSLSKINRIEGGEVTISHTDLRALLDYLAIADKETVDRLAEDARAARRRGWWDEPRYRAHLNRGTLQLLQFESEAQFIRCFQPTLLPGAIQTPGYAEAIINFWAQDLSEQDRAVRLEVRLQRHRYIFEREKSIPYLLILDESVIWREVGGLQVMAEQLEVLLSLIERGQVTVRMVRLAESGATGMIGPFMLFDLAGDEDAVLYRESYVWDEVVQTPEHVRRHREIFDQLWQTAMHEDATRRFVEFRLAAMRVGIDRGASVR